MKQKQLFIGNIIGIFLIIFVIIAGKISYVNFIKSLSGTMDEAAAIGVIGGADGPTSIFVSGGFDSTTVSILLFLPLLLVAILLALNVLYFKKEKKR